ncbi:MAG: hypothetical protein Q4E07_04900 [Eubacteriales bacterium]|nr:hypothetical protein [Eubacteriales bacterium]
MNDWKQKLMLFMQGRNGLDALGIFSTKVYIALVIINMLLRGRLSMLLTILLVVTVYRLFSKNIAQRRIENEKFLAYQKKAQKQFLQIKNRIKERNTHRYRRCPNCKTMLRLKKQTGAVNVHCPVCKTDFTVNIKF